MHCRRPVARTTANFLLIDAGGEYRGYASDARRSTDPHTDAAPNANAHMERWIGSVRRECLDRLLILGRRQLEHVLRIDPLTSQPSPKPHPLTGFQLRRILDGGHTGSV
jgi:hypothetical protein